MLAMLRRESSLQRSAMMEVSHTTTQQKHFGLFEGSRNVCSSLSANSTDAIAPEIEGFS